MEVTLKHSTYTLEKDYKHQPELRASFNALAQATFGIDFEFWYAQNHWGAQYIPYSLLDGKTVVSNVSISKMNLLLDGQPKLGIQIGTVMTHKDYRHQGLNRFLLELIIDEWQSQCDFLYLFANDSVLDFYPKFNFERVPEYQHSKSISVSNASPKLRQLNIDNSDDRDLLLDAIKDPSPIARISVRNNTALIMFYCLTFKKNNIYYLEKLKAIVIAEFTDDTLSIDEVFSKQPIQLDEVILSMTGHNIKMVRLGFTPLEATNFNSTLLESGDTLFVLKNGVDNFRNKPWRFPVLSHG